MGVTHGKKRELQNFADGSETQLNRSGFSYSPPVQHAEQTAEKFWSPPLHSEEEEEEVEEVENTNLIRPQKPLNPLKASKSHQELQKELQMTHKRRVSQGKSELQRALEKKRWDQRIKASRDQEEEKKNRSPFYQELLKRHQKIEKQEGDRGQRQEGPEFLRVKERLRKTTVLDSGEEV